MVLDPRCEQMKVVNIGGVDFLITILLTLRSLNSSKLERGFRILINQTWMSSRMSINYHHEHGVKIEIEKGIET